MRELKWVSFPYCLMLLLNLGVGSSDEKWVNDNQVGYDGGFCLPGICFGGGGDLHLTSDGGGLNLGSGGGGLHLGGGDGGLHLGIDGSGVNLGVRGGGGVHLPGGGGGSIGDYLGDGSGVGSPTHLGAGDDSASFGNRVTGVGSTCEYTGGRTNICSGGHPRAEGRETMYCTPVSCETDECSGLHVHMDKGLYNSLVSKYGVTNKKGKPSIPAYQMPETFKQNGNNVSKEDVAHEPQQAAMAPESN